MDVLHFKSLINETKLKNIHHFFNLPAICAASIIEATDLVWLSITKNITSAF